MDKSTNEIRFSLESAQRMRKIEGNFVGNTFEISMGKGDIQGAAGCINILMIVGSWVVLCGYLVFFKNHYNWMFIMICLAIGAIGLIINFLAKKFLVIDFNSQLIYTKSMLLGKQCEENKPVIAFSDIDRFAIDTIPARKRRNQKHGPRYIPYDYNIVKSRNFRAFAKFYHFYSQLMIIKSDGSITHFYPINESDNDFKKLALAGNALSEAFGVPITICPKDKKLLAVNENDLDIEALLFYKYGMNNFSNMLKRHVEFSEEGDLIVVPVFSEEDCLEMEKEAKANKGFWF